MKILIKAIGKIFNAEEHAQSNTKNKSVETIFDLKVPPLIDNPRWSEFKKSFVASPSNLKFHNDRFELVWKELNLKPGSKILEIGGGLGFTSLELANRGAICIDLDIVKENAEIVTHLAKNFQFPLELILGDSCDLPFDDNEFDAVFSFSTFEHIRDQQVALDEQTRVLRKGGRLLICDGNFFNPIQLYTQIFIRPRTSKGKQGGFRWLFTKGRVYKNYGIGWPGKDEDIKTTWWWRRNINKRSSLKPIVITTSESYRNQNKLVYRLLKPFGGDIIVVAEKVS